MSTRIENGYLLQVSTLEEAKNIVQQLQEKSRDVVTAILAQNMAKEIGLLFSALPYEEEETLFSHYIQQEHEETTERSLDFYGNRTPFSNLFQDFVDRYQDVQRTGYRDPDVDISCTVTLHQVGNKFLALLFHEHALWKETWCSLPRVIPYSYWNHTDREKGTTQQQWKQRKVDWEQAIGTSTPAESGIVFDMAQVYPKEEEVKTETILSYIKPGEDRLKTYVMRQLINQRAVALKQKGDSSTDHYDVLRRLTQAEEWIRTEEGKEQIIQRVNALHSRFIHTVSLEDLHTPFSELRKKYA